MELFGGISRLAFLPVFFVFFSASVCPEIARAEDGGGGGDRPKFVLEPMYSDSDPSLPWPPSQGDPKDWPGHGDRLGKHWPRTKVPVLSAPPESFLAFERDYVSRKEPVVLDGLLREMTTKSGFDLGGAGATSGRAAMSHVLAQSSAGNVVKTAPFRDVYLSEDGAFVVRDHLHRNFKTQFALPPAMRCERLVDNFLDSRHVYHNGSLPHPLRKERNHQVYCQLEGEKEVLLVAEEDFPSWSRAGIREDPVVGDVAVTVAAHSVDFEAHPEIREIKKMSIARLTPGQCLFVPAEWIHQQNALGKDHSFELRWSPFEGPSECDEGFYTSSTTLGDVAWKGEAKGQEPKSKSSDSRRRAVDLVSAFVDRYLLSEAFDLDRFMESGREDPDLRSDLQEWTEECDGINKEIFGLLDRNGDGKLDQGDLENMDKGDKLDRWAGRIFDRWSYLRDMAFDQWLDSMEEYPKANLLPGSDGGDAYQQEKERMEEYMREMEEKRAKRKEEKKQKKDEL